MDNNPNNQYRLDDQCSDPELNPQTESEEHSLHLVRACSAPVISTACCEGIASNSTNMRRFNTTCASTGIQTLVSEDVPPFNPENCIHFQHHLEMVYARIIAKKEKIKLTTYVQNTPHADIDQSFENAEVSIQFAESPEAHYYSVPAGTRALRVFSMVRVVEESDDNASGERKCTEEDVLESEPSILDRLQEVNDDTIDDVMDYIAVKKMDSSGNSEQDTLPESRILSKPLADIFGKEHLVNPERLKESQTNVEDDISVVDYDILSQPSIELKEEAFPIASILSDFNPPTLPLLDHLASENPESGAPFQLLEFEVKENDENQIESAVNFSRFTKTVTECQIRNETPASNQKIRKCWKRIKSKAKNLSLNEYSKKHSQSNAVESNRSYIKYDERCNRNDSHSFEATGNSHSFTHSKMVETQSKSVNDSSVAICPRLKHILGRVRCSQVPAQSEPTYKVIFVEPISNQDNKITLNDSSTAIKNVASPTPPAEGRDLLQLPNPSNSKEVIEVGKGNNDQMTDTGKCGHLRNVLKKGLLYFLLRYEEAKKRLFLTKT